MNESPARVAARLLPLILVSGIGCGPGDNPRGPASSAGADDKAIVNPTGSCGTRINTARAGYNGAGGTWVPDCQNPLLREYWRVMVLDGTTAATLPRMDGDPTFQTACLDATDDLHGLVTRYDLCAPATSVEQVNVINGLAIGDALRLTHFLHQHLKFAADGTTLNPFAIPGDILDACALHANTSELQAMCDRERKNLDAPLGLTYSGPAADELADRLNELYGIGLP